MYTTLTINALLWVFALVALFGVSGLVMAGLDGADHAQRGVDHGWQHEGGDELAAAA